MLGRLTVTVINPIESLMSLKALSSEKGGLISGFTVNNTNVRSYKNIYTTSLYHQQCNANSYGG